MDIVDELRGTQRWADDWRRKMRVAADEIERQRAEIETLKKDAERYRWLTQNVTHCPANATPILAAVSNRIWYHATCDTRHDTLGNMIDAALAAKEKQPWPSSQSPAAVGGTATATNTK